MADVCSKLSNPNLTFFDQLKEYVNCKIMEGSLAQGAKIAKNLDGKLFEGRPMAPSERIEGRSEYYSNFQKYSEFQSEFQKELKLEISAILKISGLDIEIFPKELRYLNVGYLDRKGVEQSKQFVAFTSIEKGNEHYGNHETKWVAVNYTNDHGKPETVYLKAEEHRAYKNHLQQSLRKNFSRTVFEVMNPFDMKPLTPEQLTKMVGELCAVSEKLCPPDFKNPNLILNQESAQVAGPTFRTENHTLIKKALTHLGENFQFHDRDIVSADIKPDGSIHFFIYETGTAPNSRSFSIKSDGTTSFSRSGDGLNTLKPIPGKISDPSKLEGARKIIQGSTGAK